MTARRLFLAAAPLLLPGALRAQPLPVPPPPPSPAPPRPPQAPQPAAAPRRDATPFEQFLNGVAEDAKRQGVRQPVIDAAFRGLAPNQRVIQLDGRQAEFTLTWDQYRERTVSETRIATGRRLRAENGPLLDAIATRYNVAPTLPVAIWGLETNYGTNTGGFGVIEALATLAFEGRRREFFRRELIAALKILNAGHVQPGRMQGSWAGAMGQPQFMPTSFERFAVDFDGDGHANIWDSRADALASIANYLARNGAGWRWGEPWLREAVLPPGFDTELTGREKTRPMQEWLNLGVRTLDGGAPPALEAALLLPDLPNGPSRQAYFVFANFNAIRRYNPSNFYALAVGLLAEAVA
jgi:membrane-bound lytic murein transglycosylase B